MTKNHKNKDKIIQILMIIFSATNNTQKIGQEIKKQLEELGAKITIYNIANRETRTKALKINNYDGIIFGFPIYAWRSPKPVRAWISKLSGENELCAMFFTYGGIQVGVAHYDTKRLLEQQGLRVIASAEFVSKHTYNLGGWDLNVDRPNKVDLDVAREYARLILNRFTGEDQSISKIPNPHISKRILDKVKLSVDLGIKTPKFDEEKCNSCGICENICPTGAINYERKKIDRKKCIKCYRCIHHCPENALIPPDLREQLEFSKKKNNLTSKIINSKKSKIL
ncbi:MAG: 4Fe-4S dicluster domain-containing protein [Promethearchaeota archaeon]|nr:MAG: 4Fe-4S dicluster domain-containing protein [Candidatus Lokiarchaeota archaeon]